MIQKLITLFCLLLFLACKQEKPAVKEFWIDKPVKEWPDLALTNKISFTDTIYTNFANSFLINTGFDTLGISCKHLFMVFQNQMEYKSVSFESNFISWKFYPKNDTTNSVAVKHLINSDKNEPIGQFNTLKVRDWILFETEKNKNIFPLKIRYAPIKDFEIVYAIGWGMKQKDNSKPVLIKLQSVMNLGEYYYVKTLSKNIQPEGRSGSPVIDKNGYLVGIVSGAEGNLGVIGSVNYLKKMFDKYNIQYQNPEN